MISLSANGFRVLRTNP
ncbi:unnamed protein product, partial [Rotaria sordida]